MKFVKFVNIYFIYIYIWIIYRFVGWPVDQLKFKTPRRRWTQSQVVAGASPGKFKYVSVTVFHVMKLQQPGQQSSPQPGQQLCVQYTIDYIIIIIITIITTITTIITTIATIITIITNISAIAIISTSLGPIASGRQVRRSPAGSETWRLRPSDCLWPSSRALGCADSHADQANQGSPLWESPSAVRCSRSLGERPAVLVSDIGPLHLVQALVTDATLPQGLAYSELAEVLPQESRKVYSDILKYWIVANALPIHLPQGFTGPVRPSWKNMPMMAILGEATRGTSDVEFA